jgi:hypothetical protein
LYHVIFQAIVFFKVSISNRVEEHILISINSFYSSAATIALIIASSTACTVAKKLALVGHLALISRLLSRLD